jgi:hypothetical protein
MPLANLPARGERAAPSFDDTQPEELERYFDELQAQLARHNVTDENEMKVAALKYLAVGVGKLWKSTVAWNDQTATFEEFKAEIFVLYPGASGDRTYTIQDLDTLTGRTARIGILSGVDLGEYHRKFLLISRYLIGKNRMATQEQSRAFFRGLQPDLEARVRQRLQQKFIDHYPDDPYDIIAIYEAISYVLGAGPAMSGLPPAQTSTLSATIPSPPADQTSAKIEALTAVMTTLGEMFKTAIQSQQPGAKPRSAGVATTGMSGPSSSNCNFCGGIGHFIRECEVVTEFIRVGKCKRSVDGKVVLPSGAMVPRSITGAWLRDRIDEYHRQNPGQTAAQMLFEVATVATAPMEIAAGQTWNGYPVRHVDQYYSEDPARAYALNRPHRPRPEVVITTRPPRRGGRAGQIENAGDAEDEAAPHPTKENALPPLEKTTAADINGQNQGAVKEATHPYASVPDATYAPAPVRHAAPQAPAPRHNPAYNTAAKIHDPQIAKVVFERAMETPITVTQRELLSLAPEVRSQVADATIRKRVPREPLAQTMIEEITDDEEDVSQHIRDRSANFNAHMPATYVTAARTPPANATIIADPYEAYLRENATQQGESDIRVASESNALRAIQPLVDGQDRVEAILDPGCQIVAMSEEVCNALALPYDPTIRLNMVSANGGIDQSLGLARNVPFIIGNLTLYLQVHVLRDPAYDILLGRPFDVLTQSVVRNFSNEDQTITILDPNTGKRATVPTIPRGTFRFAQRRTPQHKCKAQQQDF